MKKAKPKTKPARSDTDHDERPTLARARAEAQSKRARNARAHDEPMIMRLVEQLGVNRQDLDKRADADFAEAKAESADRLKQLRANQRDRIKARGPLRPRIEAMFMRAQRPEVIK